MPARPGQHNRGPAAAAENRLAILAAAHDLFGQRGYRVPLRAIAQAAGVGQGVLYRHFPTRLDLAFAVFETNFAELEGIAASEDPAAFHRLWARLVELSIDEAAFIEMVVDARRQHPDYAGTDRLLALIEGPLQRARSAGVVSAGLAAADVILAQRMVFGIVATASDPHEVRAAVEAASARFLAPDLDLTDRDLTGPA